MSQKVHKVYKVSGMHCVSCATNIEWCLEDLGVKSAVSFAKSQIEFEHDEEKITEDTIKMAISRAGYSVSG